MGRIKAYDGSWNLPGVMDIENPFARWLTQDDHASAPPPFGGTLKAAAPPTEPAVAESTTPPTVNTIDPTGQNEPSSSS